MADVIIYIVLGVLLLAGLVALSRPRTISDEEYEEMKGRTSMVGNALQGLQDVLEPHKADALRKAKAEVLEEDEGGDPPDPGDDPPEPVEPSRSGSRPGGSRNRPSHR